MREQNVERLEFDIKSACDQYILAFSNNQHTVEL